MAADWRAQLATPKAKEAYIRNVMGIEGAKKTPEYRNAYRYLDLMAKGQRSGNKAERFRDVRLVAEIAAEKKERGISVVPQGPHIPRENREWKLGDTLNGWVRFSMEKSSGDRVAAGPQSVSEEYALGYLDAGDMEMAYLICYMGEIAAKYARVIEGYVY